MADHDIQKSHHLLKALEEEMVSLRNLMSQQAKQIKQINLKKLQTPITSKQQEIKQKRALVR